MTFPSTLFFDRFFSRTLHITAAAAVFLLLTLPYGNAAHSQYALTTYFPDTEYELNIYRLDGREPGPVMMVIGGIHNEPGGYLTVDQFVDIPLLKGVLILVPRANFETIIKNERGVSGDMNRLFHLTEPRFENDHSFETVKILKEYISKSDVFLNMHDGSGFYRPEYIDDMHQPLRYGQSIIVDTDIHTIFRSDEEVTMPLQEIAERVCRTINGEISEPEHHFRCNNHDTFSPNTMHAEQQRSATYYALSTYDIPAFGVETSTSIRQHELRVRYQTLVLNAFMREFGIVRDVMNRSLPEPILGFITVSVNDEQPRLYRNGGALKVSAGDRITITHIESNYERGLSADILNYGRSNDFGRPVAVHASTSIIIRKDSEELGEIPVRISGEDGDGAHIESGHSCMIEDFIIEINGYQASVHRGGTLTVVTGDVLRITDTVPSQKVLEGVNVDFFGFVPRNARNNDGNDIGYAIETDRDLMPFYSRYREGTEYQVRAVKNEETVAQMRIRLREPRLEYMLLRSAGGNKVYLEDGDVYDLARHEILTVVGLKANVSEGGVLKVNVVGFAGGGNAGDLNRAFDTSKDLLPEYSVNKEGRLYPVEVTYKRRQIGRVFIRLPGKSPSR